jgi:hypothetical protein
MKKSLFLIVFIFSVFAGSAQVLKFKVTSVSFKDFDEKTQQWVDWTDPKDVDILGFFDIDNDRIKIFSETEQTYDVIESKGRRTDSDGDDIIEWICIDHEGYRSGVRLFTLNSQNSSRQLYIDYSNFIISYDIYFLD